MWQKLVITCGGGVVFLHHPQVRVVVTDPSDHFFYHSLVLPEEDFAHLKAQQVTTGHQPINQPTNTQLESIMTTMFFSSKGQLISC